MPMHYGIRYTKVYINAGYSHTITSKDEYKRIILVPVGDRLWAIPFSEDREFLLKHLENGDKMTFLVGTTLYRTISNKANEYARDTASCREEESE